MSIEDARKVHGRNAEERHRPAAAHYTQKQTQNAKINPEVLGLEISEEETEGTLLTLLFKMICFPHDINTQVASVKINK